MDNRERERVPTVASVRGVTRAVQFLAFFGALWALIGIGGMGGLYEPWLAIVVVAAAAALLAASLALRLQARGMQAHDPRGRASKSRAFRLVFALEIGLIVAAYVVLRLMGQFDLFFPAMMLIVGVHFFPLAALFAVGRYYAAGGLLCALALVTTLVVPERIALSGTRIAGWSVVLGFGGAMLLWVVGLLQWVDGRRLLEARPQ